MFLKLAWRNIWRNKGRSFITMASIFFAVLFASFMNSFQKGAWVYMLDNVVNFYYGYAQIHAKGYWEDQSINNSFEYTSELEKIDQEIPKLRGIVPRLESFTLASYSVQTKGMLVVGTDPEKENALTGLKSKLIGGEYIDAFDKSVLVAEEAASDLGLEVGDSIVMISQGYHGVSAAGKYPVKGIIKFASPDLNKKMIYMPLQEAQYFFGAENRLTSIALKINDRADVASVLNALEQKLNTEEYEFMDWKAMIPELVEAQKSDAAGNYVFLLVLYVLITFGIFGTILMMVKEREYEYGILIAIGMKRSLLSLISWMEIVILGLIGAMAGIAACIPLVYYFNVNPLDLSGSEEMAKTYEKWGFGAVMPTAFEFNIFFYQALIVFILTSILASFAVYKLHRLKPVEAMKE